MAEPQRTYPDDETLQEHVRNALTIVQLIIVDEPGLSHRLQADLQALQRRLAIVLHQLVRR